MKTKRMAGILCLLLLASLLQVRPLLAENEMSREKDLSRIRKKVETLRAWQLTEELDLDEKTSSQLFPAMKEADRERWRIEASNRELIKELSQHLQEREPDSQRINEIIDKLQSNREEMIRAEDRHLKKVRQILSPADTARYILFQIKFQRQIKQRIHDAVRERRPPGSQGGGGWNRHGNDDPRGYGDDGAGMR